MVNEDGTVDSIYVHCDGYPKELGRVLKTHYKDRKKVEKLISLGDCSCVKKNVEPQNGMEHSYDNPQPDVTVAYVRDRGEDWDDCEFHRHMDEHAYWTSDIGYFGYLYGRDDKWSFMKCHGTPKPL